MATVVGIREEGKLVNMQTEHGETFLMKTEGQDITSGYPDICEAIQRTSLTLVRLSQLTEPNCVYGLEEKRQGKRKIGWSQAIYPLRARLQELKSHLLSEKWDEVLEDEFMELKSGEQAFMATRPKLIQAGYTTLDSIPRIKKGSGTRFYCPALKGADIRTQEKVSKWIQLLHKHSGIKPLAGMTMSELTDKYTIKRNKIRNRITLLRGQAEDGVAFFLDKVKETINACDNLILTWRTHGTPLGDRKVKETMHTTVTSILEEIEQWRENSSTDGTLTSLTSIETFIEEISEMNHAILREEEDAATEFPSTLKLLIKKINITGNNPLIRQWWYDVMTSRPPSLSKNEKKY